MSQVLGFSKSKEANTVLGICVRGRLHIQYSHVLLPVLPCCVLLCWDGAGVTSPRCKPGQNIMERPQPPYTSKMQRWQDSLWHQCCCSICRNVDVGHQQSASGTLSSHFLSCTPKPKLWTDVASGQQRLKTKVLPLNEHVWKFFGLTVTSSRAGLPPKAATC